MTRVKVCGLTNERDVRLTVRCGAWACGFVLTRSPRRIGAAHAAELVRLTGRSLAVAVVTDEPPAWIAGVVAHCRFGAVQLSAGADGPCVQAVRAAALTHGLRPLIIAAADTVDASAADLVLLDSRTPEAYGGTGRTLDWKAIAAARAPRERLVLAGGLRPSNAKTAIGSVRPFAVDVTGGVERAPGVKDPRLLRELFSAVATADRSGGIPS
jgi:phosphoribosylanthranilate isomerase